MQDSTPTPIHILLVEDNPDDVLLTDAGLRDAKIANQLIVASDGVAALEMLRRTGVHASLPPIDLVLLDLKLPRMNGREVLAELKADPALEHIPVVLLTSSIAEEDIVRAQGLRAAAYITKPLVRHDYLSLVDIIESFWLAVVKRQ